MQTEWIWEAKANQAILTEKRSQKVWLKQDLLNRKHVYALLQRSRDIFFSLLAIIVLSPLMLLTALLIVLDDPHGSPIFSELVFIAKKWYNRRYEKRISSNKLRK